MTNTGGTAGASSRAARFASLESGLISTDPSCGAGDAPAFFTAPASGAGVTARAFGVTSSGLVLEPVSPAAGMIARDRRGAPVASSRVVLEHRDVQIVERAPCLRPLVTNLAQHRQRLGGQPADLRLRAVDVVLPGRGRHRVHRVDATVPLTMEAVAGADAGGASGWLDVPAWAAAPPCIGPSRHQHQFARCQQVRDSSHYLIVG